MDLSLCHRSGSIACAGAMWCTAFPPRSGERADPRAALRGFGGMTLGSFGLAVRSV
jgi:hypothetical protein